MRGSWLVVGALVRAASSDGNASFHVRESVEQLHVMHADPGVELAVVDRTGATLASGVTDAQGSLMFRNLPPGHGYVVRTTAGQQRSRHLHVLGSPRACRRGFYDAQPLQPGFTTSRRATAPRCRPT